jgi:hypothetical protein
MRSSFGGVVFVAFFSSRPSFPERPVDKEEGKTVGDDVGLVGGLPVLF